MGHLILDIVYIASGKCCPLENKAGTLQVFLKFNERVAEQIILAVVYCQHLIFKFISLTYKLSSYHTSKQWNETAQERCSSLQLNGNHTGQKLMFELLRPDICV